MITNELRKAAKEINEIVNNIVPNDYVLKIPLKFRKFLKEIEDQEYDFQIDINKDISEQNLSEKAKDIIAVIYRNYWCSEEERIEFDKTLADNEMLYQEEIRRKYNPDNLFKNNKNLDTQGEETKEVAIVGYKEQNFIQKILEKIRNLFTRKNYEEELYKKYGKANEIQQYNLKLLFIADTHNCLKDNNEVLNYIKKQNDYDYCILLGDHSASDLEEILNIIPINKICGVLGNHDSWEKYDKYKISHINGKVINIKGIKIVGISGAFKYKNSNEYALYTHEESIKIANNTEKADILITHDKAFIKDNHNPVHDGLKGITEYIYKNHIALHIHGHLHEEKEEILRNGTKSICLYMAKLVEL